MLLASGLDGIANQIEAPPPVEENVYDFDDAKLRELNIATLPQTLGEAIQEMEKSELLADALGPHLYPQYLDAARSQWDGFRQSVGSWELDRYLTL